MTVVLFPGRMNPPHLGHIMTILKAKEKYGCVIVAVIDDEFDGVKPNLIDTDAVIGILNDIFRHVGCVTVIDGGMPFRLRDSFDDLPDFDFIVSGSMDVLDNCRSHGMKVEYIGRSPLYRGEFIREACRKEMNI